MYAFKVPDIGEGVVEAEVLEWHVAEGDVVDEDQLLVELLTDKAEIEIPSPRAGRIARLHFAVGDTARVGEVLIEIDDSATNGAQPGSASSGSSSAASSTSPSTRGASASSASGSRSGAASSAASTPSTETSSAESVLRQSPSTASSPAPRAETASKRTSRSAVARESAQPAGSNEPPLDPEAAHRPPRMPARPRAKSVESHASSLPAGGPIQAVPAVRELAKRLGVELGEVRGTGPRGRIMRRDVEAHASGAHSGAATPAAQAPPSQPVEADPQDWSRQPLRGLRRVIAERMSSSRRTAAHFTYVDEVDMTSLLEATREGKAQGISPLAFIARACVRALSDFPILNASIDDARGEIILKGRVHLGIAAATDNGLLVPVVRDAAELDVPALGEKIRVLGEGARAGSLAPSELRGSTFTITSLGKLGGVISTPILNPPEVAILGVNAIRKLPRIIEGSVVARSVMNLSLSVDHRIADGRVAAEFVQAVKSILEAPGALLQDVDHA